MCVIKGLLLTPGWLPGGTGTDCGKAKKEELPAEVENTLAELRRMKVKIEICEKTEADADAIRPALAQTCRDLNLKPDQCLVISGEERWIDAAAADGFHCAGIGKAAYYEKAEHSLNRFVEALGCI